VVASLIVVASIVIYGSRTRRTDGSDRWSWNLSCHGRWVARYVREAVPATLVRLRKPTGVAITDSGEVLISDAGPVEYWR